jgi:hypothetical protein
MRSSLPHPSGFLTRLLRSRLGRACTLAWLLSQTAAGALTPIADALAGHGAEVVAHMEDDRGTHCPPAHSEMGCHLAAVTGAPSSSDAAAVEGGIEWRRIVSVPAAWDEAPPVGAARALPPGRGPPLA